MNCPRCQGARKVHELSRTSYESVWVDCPRCSGKGVVTLFVVKSDGFALRFIQNVLGRQKPCFAREEEASHFNSVNEAISMASRFGLREGTYEINPI